MGVIKEQIDVRYNEHLQINLSIGSCPLRI